MADITDLPDLAETFLAACVSALDTIPTLASGYGGSPARAFISPGPAVLDCCEQLTVHIVAVGEGASAPAPPRTARARINKVTLVALAARCVPVPDSNGDPPSPDAQQAAGYQLALDKWALWNHLFNMVDQGFLFDTCGDVEWLGLTALTPQGGCGGSQLTVRVSLDGYQETIGS
jgi:hypothetical protein